MSQEEAYVTLSTNDEYSLGALVLAHSLRNSGTTRALVCLVTPGVSSSMIAQLSTVYDLVQLVDVMDSQDEANLTLLARPELGVTLTKVHAWNLTQFKKAVFLDADCLVVRNCDELFEREELSASADIGWPDCFNSGVFVFRPSAETYRKLIDLAQREGSFDGGDQGLLNTFFGDWATKDISRHLSFVYNMVATVIYSYAPAYKRFGENVKIVHFLGAIKPWTSPDSPTALGQYLQLWWNIFRSQVQRNFDSSLTELVSKAGSLHLGAQLQHHQQPTGSPPHHEPPQVSRQSDWESGRIDYLGADRFDNIQRKIQQTIGKPLPAETAAQSSASSTASSRASPPLDKKERSPPKK